MDVFKPIQIFSDLITYNLFQLTKNSNLANSVNFFIYDSIKIIILLFVISFLMGIINFYFPVEKLKNYLIKNKLYGLEYLLASLFGAITPFCSCSSIPLFIGFVKGGIPLGVTFSFLITSPLVNEVAIAMFLGLFGIKITFIYVISGILLGIIGGFILGKLKLENQLTDFVKNIRENKTIFINKNKKKFIKNLPNITRESFSIVKKVLIYVIIGIAIGATIHGFVPTGFFEKYINTNNPFSVPIAVLMGVPMYSNAAGVLPIIQVLIQKGIPIGTALAFMMAIIGLSLPGAILLKKVMKTKLLLIFFGIVTLFIIFLGYLYNLIL